MDELLSEVSEHIICEAWVKEWTKFLISELFIDIAMQHLLHLRVIFLHSLLLDNLDIFIDLSSNKGSETLSESEECSWLSFLG